MTEKRTIQIKIEAEPRVKAELKAVGGADRDQWNDRLLNLTIRALPLDQTNVDTVSHIGSALLSGIVDIRPADPIEGILISQIVVANEAALSMYQRAWSCPPDDYFEAHTKYLQLADRASRTVAMLTERLDQHRGRGQQQIVVKHVTVNADQAVVTDSVVTAKSSEAASSSAKLVAATTAETPMEILEMKPAGTAPVGDGGPKAK